MKPREQLLKMHEDLKIAFDFALPDWLAKHKEMPENAVTVETAEEDFGDLNSGPTIRLTLPNELIENIQLLVKFEKFVLQVCAEFVAENPDTERLKIFTTDYTKRGGKLLIFTGVRFLPKSRKKRQPPRKFVSFIG